MKLHRLCRLHRGRKHLWRNHHGTEYFLRRLCGMMRQKMNIRQRILFKGFLCAPDGRTSLTFYSGGSTPSTRGLIITSAFQSTTPLTRSSFTLLGHRAPSIARIMCSGTRVMMSIHHISTHQPYIPLEGENTFWRSDCDSTRRSMDESPCGQRCAALDVPTSRTIDCMSDTDIDCCCSSRRIVRAMKRLRPNRLQTFAPCLNGLRRRPSRGIYGDLKRFGMCCGDHGGSEAIFGTPLFHGIGGKSLVDEARETSVEKLYILYAKQITHKQGIMKFAFQEVIPLRQRG